MKKLTVCLTALLLSVAACVKVETPSAPLNNRGEYAITFSHQATKASYQSNSRTGYDTFKLFVWNSNGEEVMNPYIVTYDNEYKYDVAPQELKYFSNTTSSYDFIGIIPETKTTNHVADTIEVKDLVSFKVDDNRVTGNLTADSPEEFLYSYKRVPKSAYSSVVDLNFKHGNSVIYLGFSSDRNDTKLINYSPGIKDTTDTWINLKRGYSAVGSATKLMGPGESSYTTAAALPADLVAEIKSYYSVDGGTPGDYDLHMGNSVWPSDVLKKLRVVKAIPAQYKVTCYMYTTGKTMDFFNGWKYLQDNGYDIQPANSGGKPDVWNYILIDAFVNGSAYTVVGLNCNDSNAVPQYTIVDSTIEGVRMFTADSTATVFAKHIAHTLKADAKVSADGLVFANRQADSTVITYSLPATTTLGETPVWSATTFYALPGDANLNYLVVKLSYIYNGITVYDVRVPIKLPDGGLQPGKYYKYDLYITSTGNGTNDPDEAANEKDEIIIENLNPIVVNLVHEDYEVGADKRITIK